jgi:hypothetical protein
LVAQQMPCAQKPLSHSPSAVQGAVSEWMLQRPFGAQALPETQSSELTQIVWQTFPCGAQVNGAHEACPPGWQVPRPSQVPGPVQSAPVHEEAAQTDPCG